ncbi:MAG: hypothetical protein DRN15_02550 [Thermoprotei archaeon]|nr:MAG: hypothetical protein DRM97_07605 [Thermoprotei archaeon]RLF24553.1 MAG: hypothetical protein DRN15_02550 [Thermoprotei archaeon]
MVKERAWRLVRSLIRRRYTLAEYLRALTPVIATIVAVSLLSGVIYIMVEKPAMGVPFHWPRGTDIQTTMEGIIVFIAYSGQIIGLVMVYEGLRKVYEPKYSMMLIIIGTIVLILCLATLWLIMYVKTGVLRSTTEPTLTSLGRLVY